MTLEAGTSGQKKGAARCSNLLHSYLWVQSLCKALQTLESRTFTQKHLEANMQSRQEVCFRAGCFAVQESVLRLLTLGTLPNQEAESAGAASPVEQGYFANSCVHSGCQCAAFVLQCIYVITEVYCSYRTKTARPERLLARSDSRDPRA